MSRLGNMVKLVRDWNLTNSHKSTRINVINYESDISVKYLNVFLEEFMAMHVRTRGS